jgi:hypothetical protein
MREAIESLFSSSHQDDLILLFFSGYIVQDDRGKLYFSTSITCQSPRADLIGVSAISTGFIHSLMNNSPCQHQVVIIDCCFSRASVEEIITSDDYVTAQLKTLLGGEGRAILTSVTSNPNSFMGSSSSEFPLKYEESNSAASGSSIYTRYLVEAMGTRATDLDGDDWISVKELHEYASNKVQTAPAAGKLGFYALGDGGEIVLAKVLLDDPKLKYRQAVESWVNCGEIPQASRSTLDQLAASLGITPEDLKTIEAEVLQLDQQHQEKLQHYQQELAQAIANNYPLGTQERENLRNLQQSLELPDQDIATIEAQMVLNLADFSQAEEQDQKPEVGELTGAKAKIRNGENSLSTSSPTSEQLNNAEAHSAPRNPEDTPLTALKPTQTTVMSEDQVNNLAHEDPQQKLNSVATTPRAMLPEDTPTQATPGRDLSSDLMSSQTSPPLISTFPNKLLLPIGIGGVLAIVTLAMGISTRKTVTPPVAATAGVSPAPDSSVELSPTIKNSDKSPSLTPLASPERQVCQAMVIGNLRSEPAPFRNNIIDSFSESFPVTGKQTPGGWVEVKLSNQKLAWAHRDVISNKKQMDACLVKEGITINTVEDIIPPLKGSSDPLGVRTHNQNSEF